MSAEPDEDNVNDQTGNSKGESPAQFPPPSSAEIVGADDQSIKGDPHASATENNQEQTEDKMKSYEIWQLGVNIFLSVITFVGVVIFTYELIEMRTATDAAVDAAKIAQQSMRLDERAWMCFKVKPVVFESEKELSVQIDVANIGKTPAKYVKAFTAFETVAAVTSGTAIPAGWTTISGTFNGPTFPEKADDEYLRNEPPAFVNPGDSLIGNVHVGQSLILDKNSITEFQQGKRSIFVYGTVEYSDIFGVNHWQTFCDVWDPLDSGFKEWLTHNDSDANQ